MARQPDIAAAAQQSKGLRPGLKFYSPFPFAGMNVQASNIAIDDKEFSYVENFVRLGDGNLRTVWDVGTPIYHAPQGRSIVSFFWYTIATNQYVAVFLSDGTAVQVAYPSGAPTVIGPTNKFFKAGGSLPACTQYGVLYLLISNNNTVNDYWAWDGKLLYTAGTAAPNGVTLTADGENYTSQPQVTAFGGHGSGMQFTTMINAGQVVNVQITNPGTGYETGDVVQAQFQGGGSDTGPILVANLNSGGVAAANVTAPGSGYTTATVSFSGGGGSGAAGTAIIGTGVASVGVTNQGANYTTATVSFSGGGGSGAIANAVILGGAITEIDVINPGTGYTSAPSVTITGNGTGATATASINGNSITGITITAAGSGYTSAPSITISGNGTGATAVAVLGGTNVSGATVVNPGSGFVYNPPLTVTGGGGVGASATAILTGTSVARIDILTPGQFYQKTPTVIWGAGAPPNYPQKANVTANMNGFGGVGSVTVNNGGSGYTEQPEIFFTPQKDDTGTGATARAILAPTSIASVRMDNQGLNYTDAPAIIVGGGANHSAYATIEMMPFGLSGALMETFQSRVFIGNPAPSPFDTIPPQGNFAVTAAGSITDVATADGGVLFTNSDRFLQTKYVAARQSNGYLYFLGDGSCNVVSNVQTNTTTTAGVSGVATTFNYQNVDPQVGCSWRDTVQDFGRTILFGNETGVFGLYGGAATKVSGKLDQLFANAIFPPDGRAVTPSAAIAHLYNIKHYMMLMTILDPETGLPHNVMATWNERDWTLTSQGPNLTYIGSQKLGSQYHAWGTDGQALYPLFSTPSSTLKKRLWTKVYGAPQSFMIKEMVGFYLQGTDNSAGQVGIAATVNFNVSGLALQDPLDQSTQSGVYSNMLIAQPNFPAPPPQMALWGAGTNGVYFVCAGAQIDTTSPDFTLGNVLISYTENVAFGG